MTPRGAHPSPAPSASHSAGATSTPTPAPSATPSNAPSPGATSSAAIAAANASLTNVQTMYAALPHASLSADLSTLASQMVASGQFKTAAVTPGGISATLPNGSPALVFADHVGDTSNATATTAHRVRASSAADARRRFTSFAPKSETIAVLVNSTDKSGAFNPVNQQVIASAIGGAGFNNGHYGVDEGDVELESFDQIGIGGSVDVLDIATHGMVAQDASGNHYYVWLSDTPITGAELANYATDYAAGNIQYAVTLSNGTIDDEPTFSFTPAFLANHVTFRTGAILINESCDGQEASVASAVRATLKNADVGRYFGWDNPVEGDAADQTDAFVWDRLLGEASTTLAQFVTQRVPAQRPFPLDDIDGILTSETRSGPLGTSTLTYAQSPASAAGPQANLIVSDFGGENFATPPVEYFLPSISYVAVGEDPANPTLTIYGKFPPQPGTAAVIDPTQTSATAITPTTWATDHVVIPIPVAGLGSKGLVVVQSLNGIGSNGVPLTQWSGTLTGSESATWSAMGTGSGSGSGSIGTSYAIDFRADVHSVVPSIDASPVPQNLTFTNVEGDSTAKVTSIGGAFTTSDGMHAANLALSPNAATLTPNEPPLSNAFYVRAVAGQPSSCNNAMPGPQTSGPANVFCPGVAFDARAAGTCTDDNGQLCSNASWNALFAFGAIPGVNDGLVTFTMDTSSYAITVTSSNANISTNQFEASAQVNGGIAGSIGAPVGAPNGKQPALLSRALLH